MPGTVPGQRLPSVLIIDDDRVSREVMATVLNMSGYTANTAPNGTRALEMLEAGQCAPEVILMDTQMPGLSGAPLIKQLRTRSHAKIYAISGSHAPHDVLAGADGFLMKPLGPEALQRMLEQHAPEDDAAPAYRAPIIDPGTLANLRHLMSDTAVLEIYTAVVEDLGKRTRALQHAIAQGNAPEVRRLGHAIKGGCGMAGAMEAAQLGRLLEIQSNQLDNSEEIVRQLQSATRNLQRMLDAEFPNPGS